MPEKLESGIPPVEEEGISRHGADKEFVQSELWLVLPICAAKWPACASANVRQAERKRGLDAPVFLGAGLQLQLLFVGICKTLIPMLVPAQSSFTRR